MKLQTTCKSLLIVIVISIIFSCEKEKESETPADIHGAWLGVWQSDDRLMEGSFLAPVSQTGSKFKGELFIEVHTPEYVGYRPEYFGNINGDKPRVIADISGVEVIGNGTVIGNGVSGTFTVSNDISGSFEGIKYPMQKIESSVIYEIEQTDEYYMSIFAVDNELWISGFPPNYYLVLSQSGNQIGQQYISEEIYSEALCSDGSFFWIENYDYDTDQNKIVQYDKNGNELQSFIRPSELPVGNMFMQENEYYLSFHGESAIYHYSAGNILKDSTILDYFSYSDFIRYKEGFLFSTYAPYLFYTDISGNLIEAFELPAPVFSLTVSKSKSIFGLTNETFRVNNDWKDSYKVLEFTGL